MKRVKALGGIFFRSSDPEKSKTWYQKHLGIESGPYGGVFEWQKSSNPNEKGFTAWGPFEEKTEYMNPSKKDAMINYRVENLEELLAMLKEEGVEIIGKMETYEYGKFGWIMDPDGYKIELWEPNDEHYSQITGETNTSD